MNELQVREIQGQAGIKVFLVVVVGVFLLLHPNPTLESHPTVISGSVAASAEGEKQFPYPMPRKQRKQTPGERALMGSRFLNNNYHKHQSFQFN